MTKSLKKRSTNKKRYKRRSSIIKKKRRSRQTKSFYGGSTQYAKYEYDTDNCTNNHTEQLCGSVPNCNWTKKGCIRHSGVLNGVIYEGPIGKTKFSINNHSEPYTVPPVPPPRTTYTVPPVPPPSTSSNVSSFLPPPSTSSNVS